MLAILLTYSELTHNLSSFYPIILFALSPGSSLALASIGQLPSQRLRRHYRLAPQAQQRDTAFVPRSLRSWEQPSWALCLYLSFPAILHNSTGFIFNRGQRWIAHSPDFQRPIESIKNKFHHPQITDCSFSVDPSSYPRPLEPINMNSYIYSEHLNSWPNHGLPCRPNNILQGEVYT